MKARFFDFKIGLWVKQFFFHTPKRIFQTMAICLISVVSLLSFNACNDKLEIYSIGREGVFSYSLDSVNTLYANSVNFHIGKVLVYEYDSVTKEVYARFLLEARGVNDVGNKITFYITFDIINNGNFIGVYRPNYVLGKGGINEFNYLVETSPGVYKSYNLDPALLGSAFFRVEKQNYTEKLLLGDFSAALRNDKDSTDKITFYEGQFKDIKYALD